MKHFAIAAMLMLAITPAFAVDDAGKVVNTPAKVDKANEPAKSQCGKTAAQCQIVVDELTKQLALTALGYQAARTQRDQARTGADDAQIQNYIQQEAAKAAAMPAPPPPK